MIDVMIKLAGIGLFMAAVALPIDVMVIWRTLRFGRLAGLCSGLGSAIADVCYIAIAAYASPSHFFLSDRYQFWVGLIGAVFLLYFGVKTFLTEPNEYVQQKKPMSMLNIFLSGFWLKLKDQVTIVIFLAFFFGEEIAQFCDNGYRARLLVPAVFFGSIAWWFVLVMVVYVFQLVFARKLSRPVDGSVLRSCDLSQFVEFVPTDNLKKLLKKYFHINGILFIMVAIRILGSFLHWW